MTRVAVALVIGVAAAVLAVGSCTDAQRDPEPRSPDAENQVGSRDDRVVLAQGDGRTDPWALVATDRDGLAIELREPECSSGVGDYSLPYTLAEAHMFVVDDQAFVAGPVTSDVESVEVSSGSGVAETRLVAVGDARVFVAELGQVSAVSVTALAEDGTPVDQATVSVRTPCGSRPQSAPSPPEDLGY